MNEKKKALFYTCPTCRINFETQKCPRCKKKGMPVYELTERTPENDPSYFDYVMKQKKANKNEK